MSLGKIIWIPIEGGRYHAKSDGGMHRCMICNQPTEYSARFLDDHHCSKRWLAAQKGAETRAEREDDPELPGGVRMSECIYRQEGYRMSEGFRMLSEYDG